MCGNVPQVLDAAKGQALAMAARDEASALRADKNRAEARASAAERREEAAREAAAEAQGQARRASADRDESTANAVKARAAMTAEEGLRIRAEGQRDELAAVARAAEEELDDVKAQLSRSESMRNTFSLHKERAEEALASATREAAEVRAQGNLQRDEIDRLKGEVEKVTLALQRIDEERDAASARADDHLEALSDARQELTRTIQRLTTAQQAAESERQRAADLADELVKRDSQLRGAAIAQATVKENLQVVQREVCDRRNRPELSNLLRPCLYWDRLTSLCTPLTLSRTPCLY